MIKQRIHDLIISVLPDGSASVDYTKDLFEEGILDSFAIVSLIGLIEKEFSLSLPFEELNAESFRSIYSIADMIERLSSKDN